jgi:hypothetical protein
VLPAAYALFFGKEPKAAAAKDGVANGNAPEEAEEMHPPALAAE